VNETSDSNQPDPDPVSDFATERSDLTAHASAAQDAIWGERERDDDPRHHIPGFISGDMGAKGEVSAQLRDLSRHERDRYGDVPHGSVGPAGAKLILLPMLALAAGLLALAFLIGWLIG
jgi:hypothetical protein